MQNQTKKQLKKTILENREDFIKAFIELVNEDDDFSAKFSEATLDLALNDKKFARLLMLAKELIYNKYANTDDRNFVCGNTVIDIMKSNWDEKGEVPYITLNGKMFAGYDNPKSIDLKAEKIIKLGMKGMMYWDYDADDAQGTLRNAVWNSVMSK